MNIPDKAVEAAANAMVSASPDLSGWGDLNQAEIDWYMRDAREAVAAAAPFIAAQSLRDAGKDLDARASEKHAEPVVHGIMRAESTRLHNRAAELDPS